MAVENIKIGLIDDNPYQPRQHMPANTLKELMHSIEQVGLLEIPSGRRVDGRVQLADGHLRKTCFVRLAKKDTKKWGEMPINIRPLTDKDMARVAIEENLRRQDLTPLELAGWVDKYITTFDETETGLAKFLGMSQGNVSNMRRVLRLPKEILEKVDDGRINFTMARELLVLQGRTVGEYGEWSSKAGENIQKPKDEVYLMREAIKGVGGQYGHPATVEGMQKAIYSTCRANMRALEEDGSWSHEKPLFDTRGAGCLQCEHCIITHPMKSQTLHYCANLPCWDQKQEEHRKAQAAAAIQKMEQDIIQRATQAELERQDTISQEIPADLLEQQMDEMEQRIEEEGDREELGESELDFEEKQRRAQQLRSLPDGYPCKRCMNAMRCDGTDVIATDEGLTCPNFMTRANQGNVKENATKEIPAELLGLAKEKAGTRAEVLDLNELRAGVYGGLKVGYVMLKGQYTDELGKMDDPEECTERCTKGFHYAFDSHVYRGSYAREEEERVFLVCTNPKCVAKKKAALTRKKRAHGQAKKNAESAAIREAVKATGALDKPRMKVIVLAQLTGYHVSNYYGGGDRETPITWWRNKLKLPGGVVRQDQAAAMVEALDAMEEEAIAKLIIEFMFYSLRWDGDVERYKIQTTEPLNWMGITPLLNKSSEKPEKEKGIKKGSRSTL